MQNFSEDCTRERVVAHFFYCVPSAVMAAYHYEEKGWESDSHKEGFQRVHSQFRCKRAGLKSQVIIVTLVEFGRSATSFLWFHKER